MKNNTIKIINALLAATILTIVSGCSAVPQTKVHFVIGKTKFDGYFPKQFVATNIVARVNTNGLAEFTVGYLESKNDPDVIDKASAGRVSEINAYSTLINSGISTGLKIAAP